MRYLVREYLIENGIINIQLASGNENMRDMEYIHAETAREKSPTKEPMETESHLVEFETKTTPTCLSSCLRQ